MKIYFHGTNRRAALSILRNGFRARTYFACHLEDAIAFGGCHVLEVVIPHRVNDWQFHSLKKVNKKYIVGYTVFTKRILLDNPNLRRKVFEANQDGSINGFVGKISK